MNSGATNQNQTKSKKRISGYARALAWAACAVAMAVTIAAGIWIYQVTVNPKSLFDTPPERDLAAPVAPAPSPEMTPVRTAGELTPGPTVEPTVEPSPDPYETTLSLADKALMKDTVNVMVIGVDYTTERENWKKYFYSDVMIVLAINFEQNKVDMISIPRDTYAKIYKVDGKYKMNSSFYWGGGWEKEGFLYTMKSCEWLLGGIPIDYYIGATMPGVKELVDAIGGVDYDIDVNFKIQGRQYKKGMQHLDGQGVLDYFRVRKGVDNDLGRVDRQKKLLLATFAKLKSTEMIFNAPEIIQNVEDNLYTNLSFNQMCALAAFGSRLPVENIRMHTMGGPLINIYNWNFVITDQAKRVALIKEVYGIDTPRMQKYSITYCRTEWEKMQADKYMDYVNAAIAKDRKLETPKLGEEDIAKLRGEVDAVKAAMAQGNDDIKAAREKLQKDATSIFGRIGVKINWFVNENPGKKRLTG